MKFIATLQGEYNSPHDALGDSTYVHSIIGECMGWNGSEIVSFDHSKTSVRMLTAPARPLMLTESAASVVHNALQRMRMGDCSDFARTELQKLSDEIRDTVIAPLQKEREAQ